MEEIRMLSKAEYEAAAALSNSIFRRGHPASMAERYPHVFSPVISQSFGLFSGPKLLSFIGLVPSVVWIGEARLGVFSIGSVCTVAEHRGKGLAGRILERVKRHAEAANASLLLVSGEGGLYERAGCHPFGMAFRFRLTPGEAERLISPWRNEMRVVRRSVPADLFGLQDMSRRRSARFEQSVWDMGLLSACGSIATNSRLAPEVRVCRRNGRIVAYAVLALSQDRESEATPFLLEWAGNAKDAAYLMAEWLISSAYSELELIVPWHELQLIELLNGVSRETIRQLGTVCVVGRERLLEQLAPALKMAGTYEIPRDLTDADFISFIFGTADHSNGAAADDRGREIGLPVPFPYTGGLNYV